MSSEQKKFCRTESLQKIILRLDLNVPIKNKIILDDTRIMLCLPFINKLIEKRAKIIIISHLGRPKGIKDPSLSLLPVYKYLKKKLRTNVYFFLGNFVISQQGLTKSYYFNLSSAKLARKLDPIGKSESLKSYLGLCKDAESPLPIQAKQPGIFFKK